MVITPSQIKTILRQAAVNGRLCLCQESPAQQLNELGVVGLWNRGIFMNLKPAWGHLVSSRSQSESSPAPPGRDREPELCGLVSCSLLLLAGFCWSYCFSTFFGTDTHGGKPRIHHKIKINK